MQQVKNKNKIFKNSEPNLYPDALTEITNITRKAILEAKHEPYKPKMGMNTILQATLTIPPAIVATQLCLVLSCAHSNVE